MLTFLGVNDFKMIPSVEYCSRFVELKTNFTRNLIKIKKISLILKLHIPLVFNAKLKLNENHQKL